MEFIKKIEEEVSDIKEQFSYPNDGTAFGHFVLKNCLSKIIDIDDISSLELDDFIKNHITDGANDYGIDAVICNSNNKQIHFFQFKYSEGNLFNFDEFKKTKTFLEWLLEENNNDINPNEKLKNLIEDEIKPILNEGIITFYYIGNYFEENLRSTISNLKSGFIPKVSFKIYTYEDLETLYDNVPLPPNEVVLEYKEGEIFEREEDYFYIGEKRESGVKVKSVIASIKAKSLKEILEQNDFKLFSLDVRYFKGFRGPINQTIKKEYEQGEKSNFWFLNNGINAICRDYKKLDGKIEITDFQIVNGCQTTKALDKVFNINSDITMLLKLTAISDISERSHIQDMSNKIAIASNKQNAISNRDLHSNDGVQNHLSKEFDNIGLFYDKKENSWNQTADKSKYKIKDKKRHYRKFINDELALSYLSLFLQIPVSSRGRKNLAFLDGDSGGYYEQIFDESKGPKYLSKKLMLAYLLEKLIVEKKKENLAKYKFLPANSSSDVILGLMGLALIKLQNKPLSDDLDKIREEVEKIKIEDFINDNFELLKRKEMEEYYSIIINNIDTYLNAVADLMEEHGDKPLNISNWLKSEKNYKKLVERIKPKLT